MRRELKEAVTHLRFMRKAYIEAREILAESNKIASRCQDEAIARSLRSTSMSSLNSTRASLKRAIRQVEKALYGECSIGH